MATVQRDDLTGTEQQAFERVAPGDVSAVAPAILGRLIALGLAEKKRTGPEISQAVLQFLATRGLAPRTP